MNRTKIPYPKRRYTKIQVSKLTITRKQDPPPPPPPTTQMSNDNTTPTNAKDDGFYSNKMRNEY